MLLAILIVLALAFMVTVFIFRKVILVVGAAGSWLLIMFQAYQSSDYPATFDIYMGLTLFSVAMIISCIILIPAGFFAGDKKGDGDMAEGDWDEVKREFEELQREQESTRFLHRKRKNNRSKLL